LEHCRDIFLELIGLFKGERVSADKLLGKTGTTEETKMSVISIEITLVKKKGAY
jgi:hypothetical protein